MSAPLKDPAAGKPPLPGQEVVRVDATDFSAQLVYNPAGPALLVRMVGDADMRVWATLKGFLSNVHKEALSRNIGVVRVDITDLRFMNSSCFKNVIVWLTSVKQSTNQYQIEFISSETVQWQKRSMNAVMCVADDLVRVRTVEGDSAS